MRDPVSNAALQLGFERRRIAYQTKFLVGWSHKIIHILILHIYATQQSLLSISKHCEKTKIRVHRYILGELIHYFLKRLSTQPQQLKHMSRGHGCIGLATQRQLY